MLKKFKKLGLALLLPATAMVIATPLVLTSCNASESLVIESEKQNNSIIDAINSEKTETTKQTISQLESIQLDRNSMLRDYIFPELIAEFVGYKEGENVSKTYPASNEFKDLLTTTTTSPTTTKDGLLAKMIKAFNIEKNIEKIEIAKVKEPTSSGSQQTTKDGEFKIHTPGSNVTGGPEKKLCRKQHSVENGFMWIPISVYKKQARIYAQETTPLNFAMTIEPYFTTFKEIQDLSVTLRVLNKSYGTSVDSGKQKLEIVDLYNDFANGNDSILEQAKKLSMTKKGGFISYKINFFDWTNSQNAQQKVITGISTKLKSFNFVPFKINGNYTYYVDSFVSSSTGGVASKLL